VLLVLKPYLLRTLDRRKGALISERLNKNGRATSSDQAGWLKYRSQLTALVGAIVGFLVGLTQSGAAP